MMERPFNDQRAARLSRRGLHRSATVAASGGVLTDPSAATGQTERLHDVLAGEGDILFVHNGAGPRNTYRHGLDLHAACLPWL